MKNKLLKIFSSFILIILIIISIVSINSLLELKTSKLRYSSFLAEDQPIDVLFLGSSHVMNGFFTPELWNDYGINAYNLAGSGSTIPVSYWTLVNALDYQRPKVVVMDVYDTCPGQMFSSKWGHLHEQFDVFPISYNKYQMINDIFNNKSLSEEDRTTFHIKRWELLFHLGAYHTRWTELTEDDFNSSQTIIENSRIWKGSTPLIGIVPRESHIYGETTNDLDYDNLSCDYLNKIISLCQEKDIVLLLINTGYDCSDEAKFFHDSVNAIAEKNGLIYIDFTKENIIDFETDLHSSGHNTHVNFSGAEKFTNYIGNILVNNYDLTDHREDSSYSRLWQDYDDFLQSKQRNLVSQTELTEYLMLLYDSNYRIIIEIKDDSTLNEFPIGNLITNLGLEPEEGANLYCIDEKTKQYNVLHNDYKLDTSWETILGTLSYHSNEEYYTLFLNGNEIYSVNKIDDTCKLRIAVYSISDNTLIDVKAF